MCQFFQSAFLQTVSMEVLLNSPWKDPEDKWNGKPQEAEKDLFAISWCGCRWG